ncbi:hypothetical protein H1C71_024569, partial [Ictidomys tridecemlineatus]|uniref:Vomeronasal type-1 receptor n=1 Tax=Ictidomys tridecemlineatus TaxID=43179 RepID=A0A287D1I4_ICTTR
MVVTLVKGIVNRNIFVLVHYICIFQGSEKKPIHLILIHLAFTNIITLFSRGMPRTVAFFALMNFLYDVGCKILGYLERVAWDLSISTTSLLTVVQAITIRRRLKPRSAWHVLPLFLFFWMLNSLISMNLLFYIKNISSMNTSQIIRSDNSCYFQPHNWIIRWIFIVLMVLRDAVFQGVMSGASGHMVSLLHKHHQHVLHLQTSKLLHRTRPEVKASQSVLLLMLYCFLTLHLNFSLHKDSKTEITQETLTLGYATVSPFVLIYRDGHLASFLRTILRKY